LLHGCSPNSELPRTKKDEYKSGRAAGFQESQDERGPIRVTSLERQIVELKQQLDETIEKSKKDREELKRQLDAKKSEKKGSNNL
jgi:hypothetical protein